MVLGQKNAVMIPADRIEEKDMTVIVTYQGKRIIINHAAILKNSTPSENVTYAKITKTKLGTIVEPIGSEEDDVHSFTTEEFVYKIRNKKNSA